MPSKSTDLKFCVATGLPILCVKCFRPPKIEHKRKHEVVCDYHLAVKDYKEKDNVNDDAPFNLPHFIDHIHWDKIKTSCQPELSLLFKSFRRLNEDIARRVV
jgi:hypothetical protein